MEWFRTFTQNHMILSIIIKILIAIVIIFLLIKLLGLLCSAVYALFKKIVVGGFNGINAKLDSVCAPCNKSSNPWGMVAALGFAAIFWFAPHVSSRGVSEFWTADAPLGLTRYQFGGVIIAGLVLLTGLFTARLRLPLVLFVKLLRIPLDIISLPFRFIYMITGIIGSLTGAIKPVEGTVYLNSDGGGYYAGGGTVPIRTNTGYGYSDGYQDNSGTPDYSNYESPYASAGDSYNSSPRDGFAYLGEKYDQTRAMQSGGADGYNYTVTADGSTQYYTGDYRPFSETGATVESYHLDEGYVPMENND